MCLPPPPSRFASYSRAFFGLKNLFSSSTFLGRLEMNFFLWLKPRNVVMIMEVLRELEAKAERGLEDCSGRVMPSLTTD
jgi:hypothetical protein